MIRKFLELSTLHLTADARDWLIEEGWHNAIAHRGGTTHGGEIAVLGLTVNGFFTYAPHARGDGGIPHSMPATLLPVMQLAHTNSCNHLLLQPDADIIPGLPTFEL